MSRLQQRKSSKSPWQPFHEHSERNKQNRKRKPHEQRMNGTTSPPQHSTRHRQPKDNSRAGKPKQRENREKAFRSDKALKRQPKRCCVHGDLLPPNADALT